MSYDIVQLQRLSAAIIYKPELDSSYRSSYFGMYLSNPFPTKTVLYLYSLSGDQQSSVEIITSEVDKDKKKEVAI